VTSFFQVSGQKFSVLNKRTEIKEERRIKRRTGSTGIEQGKAKERQTNNSNFVGFPKHLR
jgi:hypothetical protein